MADDESSTAAPTMANRTHFHDPRSIPGVISPNMFYVIGIALSVAAGLLVGVSFILKKKALDKGEQGKCWSTLRTKRLIDRL